MTAGRGQLGIITEADVRAAQTTLDLIAEAQGVQRALDSLENTKGLLLDVRGVLASQLADVRWAGYQEGKAVGRAEVLREAHEALDGLR